MLSIKRTEKRLESPRPVKDGDPAYADGISMLKYAPVRRHLRLALIASCALSLSAAQTPPAAVEFIDTSFENASPLWYDVAEDGTIQLHLIYDHERSSINRAAGHVHFRVHAK